MSKAKKRQQLTETELFKRAGQGHTGAATALERYERLKAQGKRPRTWYSEFNGYSVTED